MSWPCLHFACVLLVAGSERRSQNCEETRLSIAFWLWSSPALAGVPSTRRSEGDRTSGQTASHFPNSNRGVGALYVRASRNTVPGEALSATSRHGASNRFMRSGNYIRFGDWRFVHRARRDVLHLNGARRWGAGDRPCRRCGCASETLLQLPLRPAFGRSSIASQCNARGLPRPPGSQARFV